MGRGEAYRGVLLGKPEGKRPLERPGRRLEDNIKMDLQEVECEGMDWIDLAPNRDRWRALVYAIIHNIVLYRHISGHVDSHEMHTVTSYKYCELSDLFEDTQGGHAITQGF
jgi:hypothetical protein